MAQLLKYYRFHGFLKSVNSRSFIVAVLPKDKAHNRKVMDEIKGIMGSENKKAMSENYPKIAVIKGAV
ncbi:hypothetical protein [Staphylococcus succinus]|uniref:hypothetical protein n=1 Tax=Staphylococcus succinus TaxID=61015 RepID=UPI001C05CE3F|nr:hypothetical protein [Staphylococcus succinus]MBU0437779.1 hypothetical protein [Staphylococcus succinus]